MRFGALSWYLACTLCMAVMHPVNGGDTNQAEKPHKILMLLPISSETDVTVFTALAEALADRGHRIVMLVNQLPNNQNYNVFQVFHGLEEFRNIPMDTSRSGVARLASFSQKFFKISEVMELFFMRRKFDLVIIPSTYNEIAYPFLYEMPFITVSTTGLDYGHSAAIGNVLNPASVPGMVGALSHPLSVIYRFHKTLRHFLHMWFWKHWVIVPTVQAEVSERFPNLPPLLEIERNQSLTLVNSHFTMDTALPLLPSQVEVGALHCRPGQPLPEKLEAWIADAGSPGVVYFSLGSSKESNTILVGILLQVFENLEQRVIWQYDEDLEDLPENVYCGNRLPQQDILAHPNVKAFVTRGDLLSIQEALYHAVPTLATPLSKDQRKHSQTVVDSSVGLSLAPSELSAESIQGAIKQLLENPSFTERAKEMSSEMRDRLQSPIDLAVFWTEYAIRHPGAPLLRSPAQDLSWVEFLMLDVLAAMHLVVVVSFVLLRKLGQWFFFRRASNGGKHKTE